jgi:hypothetical protein
MSIHFPLPGTDPTVQKLVGFDLRQAGNYITTQCLTADASTNSTTTRAAVMTTKGLPPGKYVFRYWIKYQAAATTTGVKFGINFTGTATFVGTWIYQTTGGAAATGAALQNTTAGTPNLIEGWSERTLNTDMGPSISVDTANSDMLAILEGMLIVTAAGDLVLQHASEVAAASTVKAGTTLLLIKGE